MAVYVVMEPPKRADAVLVRDGFHLFGFLTPPIWLLWHRLWIEAIVAFAVAMVLAAVGEVADLGWAGTLLSLLVSVYVGIEGAALRIAALRRRGWREWGVVEADSFDDAEARYLFDAERLESTGRPEPSPPAAPQSVPFRRSGPALGLFSYPGKA
ncbi:DUF2628 domain-containing protein [Allomesorhizobium alhagi]|uniref:DUF2628 domain-containing protein n=1 Tax=Mesorhizobium alhagi CCNWXJ12-2 TaxID=1107882 RepID=H0HKV7_9HYPH|nr:DUF2628 domain-containing protein [Mesorhizobium alhagi]EHK58805.1 hypothetical protein MAXJ12_03823 [Mesorhizobium alhagi CCNWXJ12-2]